MAGFILLSVVKYVGGSQINNFQHETGGYLKNRFTRKTRRKRNPVMKIKPVILFTLLVLLFLTAGAQASGQIDWKTIPQQTRKILFKAQQEMNKNRFERAIAILQKFQKRRSKYNHFLVEFNIGTAYGFLGDYENAIHYLERAVALETGYAPLWLNLGKLYYGQKAYAKSGDALEKGFRANIKKEPEVLFMAMAAHYQAGNLDKTILLGEELVNTYGRESTEVVSLLANAYITTGNSPGAVNMLVRLTERHPDNSNAWKLLTQAYFKNQQYREAAVAYETYGYLQELKRDELFIMGDLFTMIGVPIRAAQYYEKALSAGGEPAEYEKMSVAYYSAYAFDKAIASIDQALLQERTYERLLLKAQLYYLQDKFMDAQNLYVAAAEVMSKDGHEWLMAGYCAMRGGELEISRELLHRATEFPAQRKEAMALLKMLTPVEEIKTLMSQMKET